MIRPGGRCEERRGGERHPRVETQPLRQTAPRPVLGPAHELGRQRISFDVPAHANELGGAFDGKRLESALIERPLAARLVLPVPPDRVGSSYPFHEPRKGLRGRDVHHQMPVIPQDAVRHQPHRVALQALGEHAEKRVIVERTRKNGQLSHASIDDVEKWDRQRAATRTRHKACRCRKRYAGIRPPAPGCGNLWKKRTTPSPS